MATKIRGAQINEAIAGDGLTLSGSVMFVNVDNSSIEINADSLRVKSGGISNAMLTNSSLTVTAGNALTGGGSISLGSSATLDVAVDGTTISTAGDQLSVIASGIQHDALSGLADDDHPQYSRADGTRAFTNTVSGVTPTLDPHLTTKLYVDTQVASASGSLLSYISDNYIDNSEMTTISGDIISYTDGRITTVSGDILNYVSANYIDNSEMTTISGDILSYVSNNYIDNSEMTTISGDILQYVSDNYIDNTEMTTISGDIISYVDLNDIWEVIDTPYDQIRPKAAHMGKEIYTSGNMTVGGDLTVTGTLFYTNTETVLVADNIMVLNYGEPGGGVTKVTAGIEIDRGTEPAYLFVFDERSDNFRIGVSGTQSSFNSYPLQPVATREENPIDTRVTWWDAASYTLRTMGDTFITVNSGSNTVTIGVNDVVETTINTDGFSLKTGASVNDIDTTITSSSTDDELVTALAIYNYVDTVSGALTSMSGTVQHNNLAGLQGGTAGEYYHLDLTDYNVLSAISSTDVSNWNAAYGWGDHAGLYDLLGAASSAVSGHELAYAHVTSYSTDNFTTSGSILAVKDDGIAEAELVIANAPADGYYLQYTTASGMQWTDVSLQGIQETDLKLENKSAECDGNTTGFTLASTPVDNSVQVFLNGLLQEKGSGKDYTQTTTAITFTVAPLTGDILVIHYTAKSV